jgi:hypothetical protein
MNTPRDPLDELLDRHRDFPEPPPQLGAKIQWRLAAEEKRRAQSWFDRLDAVCARPSFAATFVAACVLFGLFLAETRISRLHEEQSTEIARSYLQMIDPLLVTPPAATLPSPTPSP